MTTIQPTVVTATPTTSSAEEFQLAKPSAVCKNAKYRATTNEITIAEISLHVLMRHQNQRSRNTSPVPAPI